MSGSHPLKQVLAAGIMQIVVAYSKILWNNPTSYKIYDIKNNNELNYSCLCTNFLHFLENNSVSNILGLTCKTPQQLSHYSVKSNPITTSLMAPHDSLRVTRIFYGKLALARVSAVRAKMIYISGVNGSPNPKFMIPPIKISYFRQQCVVSHGWKRYTDTLFSWRKKNFLSQNTHNVVGFFLQPATPKIHTCILRLDIFCIQRRQISQPS
jgi:hypothetical protein